MKTGPFIALLLVLLALVALLSFGATFSEQEAYQAGLEARRAILGEEPPVEVPPATQHTPRLYPVSYDPFANTEPAVLQPARPAPIPVDVLPPAEPDTWWEERRAARQAALDHMASQSAADLAAMQHASAARWQQSQVQRAAADPYAWPEDPTPPPPPAPARITYPNAMPHNTAVQVAPDRIWDYSTDEYHWADQQADGTLRQRQE